MLLDDGLEGSKNCSTGNSGLIVPSHFVPLASPGMIQYGLGQMMHDGSPFGIRSPFDPGFLKWAKLFASACKTNDLALLGPMLSHAHRASKELYLGMEQDASQSISVHQNGLFMLCHSDRDLEEECEAVEEVRDFGIEARMADSSEVQGQFPGISDQIVGGAFFPNDAWVNPGEVMGWLRSELKSKVDFRFNSPAVSFDLRGQCVRSVNSKKGPIYGDKFVIATGASLQSMCKLLDAFVPIQSGKGYSLDIEVPHGLPSSSCIVGSARLAVTPLEGKVRFGGTMEIGGSLQHVNEERLARMKSSIQNLFPEISSRALEEAPVWSGLRPLTPNGLPYIGKLHKAENVFVAGGHAMMGMSLGPITGKLVSELISGKKPSLPLDNFDPNRYD